MRYHASRLIVFAAPAAAVSLLFAGCGGGGGSPGVASVTAPATTAATGGTSTTQSGSGGGGSAQGDQGAPQGAHLQVAMKVGNAADGAKFSACMRKHGVTNFPDPNGQGVIQFGSAQGIDPRSASFGAAQSACQKLLPNGGQPTPAQQAQMQQQMLAFSTCMRAHGIKDFPDPSNGGIRLRGGPGSDLNPNNPQFQAAQSACRSKLPGLKGGPVKAGRATSKQGG